MSRHWQAGDNIDTFQFFIAQILLDFIVLIPIIFLSSPPPKKKFKNIGLHHFCFEKVEILVRVIAFSSSGLQIKHLFLQI